MPDSTLASAAGITRAQLDAAVDAYFAGISVGHFRIGGGGLALDLKSAVAASDQARRVRADVGASLLQWRNAVSDAILVALSKIEG